MAGKNVAATDIRPGDVIEYDGNRAMVFKVWATQADSPISSMVSPVGLEIGWVDPSNGQANSTRLVWPDVEPKDAKLSADRRTLTDKDIADRLAADLKKRPVKRLYAWG